VKSRLRALLRTRSGHGRRTVVLPLAALAAGAALVLTFGTNPASAIASPSSCTVPTGTLSPADLPAGTSAVGCSLVGRVVRKNGLGVTVPAPGETVSISRTLASGEGLEFELAVSPDGVITFPLEDGTSDVTTVEAAADPAACSDGKYSTADRKEYGTYNWYIGDGAMPAGLTQSAAAHYFEDAVNNITDSYNDCGLTDTVSAKESYQGTTTYEADINSSGDCTSRDHKSTWDAGNLPSNTVAETCAFTKSMPGVKNDLLEADVRYNTSDYRFTNNPASSCSDLYDVRSVGTHEAGHVFGLKDLGSGHAGLTMYKDSFTCSTAARTLGRGDVLGLRSIY